MISCSVPPDSLPTRIGLRWRSVATDLLIRLLDALSDAEPVGYLAPARRSRSSTEIT
jgi:hypothetical protein